ncbi:MAG: hypothetical protein ACHQLA_00650 [Ignavibacteriales bacterium]
MELRKRAFGMAIGLVCGLFVLLGTWVLLLGNAPGGVFSKIENFCFGYTYSWGGAFIGFFWCFVYGFFAGVLVAWFYEVFSKMLYKTGSAK